MKKSSYAYIIVLDCRYGDHCWLAEVEGQDGKRVRLGAYGTYVEAKASLDAREAELRG